MEKRKVRPIDNLEAIHAGSKWIISLPGGREVRYTPAEFARYFAEIEFRGSSDPEPPVRQSDGLWGPEKEIEIILATTPASILRPNSGAGYSQWAGKQNREEKARVRRFAKETAEVLIAEMEKNLGSPIDRPLYGDNARIEVLVEWEKVITPRYSKGRYRSKVDPHDALPMMCKGIIDGLTDAGIIKDDRNIWARYEQGKDPVGAGRVVIKVQGATK